MKKNKTKLKDLANKLDIKPLSKEQQAKLKGGANNTIGDDIQDAQLTSQID